MSVVGELRALLCLRCDIKACRFFDWWADEWVGILCRSGPWHRKGTEIRDICRRMSGRRNLAIGDILRASAICTPAMAGGLSTSTSASLHCSQASTSTTHRLIIPLAQGSRTSLHSSIHVRNYLVLVQTLHE